MNVMKTVSMALVGVALAAGPVRADKKLDDALAKAEATAEKGKPEDAVKGLQKAVSGAPSAEGWIVLSRFQLKHATPEEAAATLSSAVGSTSDPAGKSQLLAELASQELRYGPVAPALKHAQEAEAAQKTPAALAALALAQIRNQEPAKALTTADAAVHLGATSADAHAARGEALLAVDRAADAQAAFAKALELDARNVPARVGLANALRAQGKGAEAVAEATKAVEADPKNGEAHVALAQAKFAADPKGWGAAIGDAKQGEFVAPKNPRVLYGVGKMFEGGSNSQQAEASYQAARAADPAFTPARVALVVMQERRGNLDAALAETQKLAAELPGNGEVQLQLGRLMLRKATKVEDYQAAIPVLEKAVATAPTAEGYALLGRAYQFLGKTNPEAVDAYEKATKSNPNNLDYKTTYGLLLGIAGDHDTGIAELQKVTSSPGYKSPDAWINLGWVYRNASPARPADSVAAYKKALELDPKSVPAQLGLGWAHSYAKEWDASLAAFQKAIALDPKVAGEANNGMAWAMLFKKDVAAAKDLLSKAQAAGRIDKRLADSIANLEKMIAAGERAKMEAELAKTEGPAQEGPNLAKVTADAQSKNAAVRRRAATALGNFGSEGVEWLSFLLRDADLNVREAAVNSVAKLGPQAKGAIPTLKAMIADRPAVDINASAEEMMRDAREADIRREMQKALDKIQK